MTGLHVMLGSVDCCICSDAVAVKCGDIYCNHLHRALLGLVRKKNGLEREPRRHRRAKKSSKQAQTCADHTHQVLAYCHYYSTSTRAVSVLHLCYFFYSRIHIEFAGGETFYFHPLLILELVLLPTTDTELCRFIFLLYSATVFIQICSYH